MKKLMIVSPTNTTDYVLFDSSIDFEWSFEIPVMIKSIRVVEQITENVK